MKCLIVDDQKIFRELIKELCTFDPSLVLIGECSNAIEAYNKILNEQIEIDLIFLDIHMPGLNGVELAKVIDDKNPLIIFITSKLEHAIDAFDLNVVDFLVKPIVPTRFLKAVEKAKNIFKNKNITVNSTPDEFVFIRESGTIKRIRITNILFFEATGDHVKIFLTNQTYSIYSPLKEVAQKLPRDFFFRVHRSFIINISKIDTTEGKTLIINNHFIPVSDTYKADLYKRLRIL